MEFKCLLAVTIGGLGGLGFAQYGMREMAIKVGLTEEPQKGTPVPVKEVV